MTYAEAIGFLNGLRRFGANFGLETTRRLAARVGNPHLQLRFIHVAGTNGKGSTCAFLESMYRASGRRVGLFTSPHLISFRERVQVDRECISEAAVARGVARVRAAAAGGGRDEVLSPTFFEFVTVLALLHFEEQRCELVIWETGLGGRLDATNIVTPLASVITSLSLDHAAWLGDTVAKIAAEKAGIIKPGIPVITSAADPEALPVLEAVARREGSSFTRVGAGDYSDLTTGPDFPLRGAHQRLNAALALAVVSRLQAALPVTDAALRQGLAHVQWAGRMQLISRGAQTVVLDGAHNPAGAQALRLALAQTFPNAWPALILGVMGDKDWERIGDLLAPQMAPIWLVPVGSERTCSPEDLRGVCERAHPAAEVRVVSSLAVALAQAVPEPLLVITGSLYLIGEALEQLGAAGLVPAGERELNDWQRAENCGLPGGPAPIAGAGTGC